MKNRTIVSVLFALFSIGYSYAQMPNIASLMANKVDPSIVPEAYIFSWKYVMEIQSEGKTMNAEYLIEKDAPYIGMRMNQAGNQMMMVMDTQNKLNIGTIGQGAQKMAMAAKSPDYVADAEKQNADKKYTFKTLPEKTILGYKCKGVEATDANTTMVFYYTNEAPVSFAELFKSSLATAKIPDAFSSYFKTGEKPLMLSVEMTDKSNGKKTSLKCLSLEKEAFTFKKSEYRFM